MIAHDRTVHARSKSFPLYSNYFIEFVKESLVQSQVSGSSPVCDGVGNSH